jgi:hypothetical protein
VDQLRPITDIMLTTKLHQQTCRFARNSLPEPPHAIVVEYRVAADDGQVLGLGLRH